jgi:RIO-like serine/threonine protein kinase
VPQRSSVLHPFDISKAPQTADRTGPNATPKVFAKNYSSPILFQEALANSEEAFQCAQNACFLRVPRIVSYHRERLLIEFEYMEGWQTITRLIRDYRFLGATTEELKRTFRLIGRALAEYHLLSGKIHGDFDSTNVLFKANEPQICLIDFSRPDFANTSDYCRGSIYRDLALFLIHLRVKYPPHQLYFAYRAMNRTLSKEFLVGYFEGSETRYEFDKLQAEFSSCLTIDYLARTFMIRFLASSTIFNIEDLRQ